MNATSFTLAPLSKHPTQFTLISTVIPNSPHKSLSGFGHATVSLFFFCFPVKALSVLACVSRCATCLMHVCSVATVTTLIRGLVSLSPACRCLVPLAGRLNRPCQFFFFSACLLLVCHWPCCVMLIKDLKGQTAFREWSAGKAGRSCEMPPGGQRGSNIFAMACIYTEKVQTLGGNRLFLIC